MLTSQFIQFDSKRNIIFNVAQIAYIERRTVIIKSEGIRETYEGFPLDGDKAYSIFVYTTHMRGMEIIYETEALRDETFAMVTAALSPYVITPPAPTDSQDADKKASD